MHWLCRHPKMCREVLYGLVNRDVETIQSALSACQDVIVGGNRVADRRCQWRVHLLIELQMEDADAVAFRTDLIALCPRQARHETLAAQFAQVVAKLIQAVLRIA